MGTTGLDGIWYPLFSALECRGERLKKESGGAGSARGPWLDGSGQGRARAVDDRRFRGGRCALWEAGNKLLEAFRMYEGSRVVSRDL